MYLLTQTEVLDRTTVQKSSNTQSCTPMSRLSSCNPRCKRLGTSTTEADDRVESAQSVCSSLRDCSLPPSSRRRRSTTLPNLQSRRITCKYSSTGFQRTEVIHYSEFVGNPRSAMGLRTAIAGTLRSLMHTISKKLAKREKRARKIFWSRFGV